MEVSVALVLVSVLGVGMLHSMVRSLQLMNRMIQPPFEDHELLTREYLSMQWAPYSQDTQAKKIVTVRSL